MQFAVIATGGKQYLVKQGTKIQVEKLSGERGARINFDKVLLKVHGDAIELGTPYIKDAAVYGTVEKQAREKKKIVFKYHSKTRYRKKKGHRQHYTEVEITKI